MLLFSKDKELVLKITNGILLIWFLAAIVFSFNNAVTLLVERPNKEDQVNTCKNQCSHEGKENCDCENSYMYEDQYGQRYEKISLYTSLANVVIVGSALYFLNREKETNKKK